ncbi:glycosyltransferase family 2 protein [Pontibacter sp. CAU 1760]
MKISIITIVFNNKETIADAINSVLNQRYPAIEYIVVDGQSTDGTVEIIESFGSSITKFVSEPDQGLYDAVNKGIGMATGEVIGLLHSDDILNSQDTIAAIARAFGEHQTETIYGDLLYVQKQDTSKTVRSWVSGSFKRENFLYGWMPPHPTFYVKREVYQREGMYNTLFKSAADYELMLRFLYKAGISTAYIPEVLVKMRVGGKSNISLSNRWRANKEDYLAWKVNQLRPRFYTRFLKPLRKLTQFIS